MVITALAGPATPATAGTLHFTSGFCEETVGGQYTARIMCYFSWTGETGTVTATFNGGSNVGLDEEYVGDGGAQVGGSCWVNHSASVTATIADSVSSASYTASLYCAPDAP